MKDFDELPENEVAILMCTEEVANKWMDESEKHGINRNNYTYHDDTLWRYKNTIPSEKQVTLDDLMLF